MIRMAVIGAGYWGPNLIRHFHNGLMSQVIWIADADPARLARAHTHFPAIQLTLDAHEAIRDPDVDAVVVVTPTNTHYPLVKASLQAHKHVWVEKPLATSRRQAEELHDLAGLVQRVLLVDHIFLYNRAVQHVKDYLDTAELGRICYLSCTRTNLGPVRVDVNAAWDLAAQDVSILNHWFGTRPVRATAVGGAWLNKAIEDAVFATLRYPNDILAHLHCSWFHPRKTREIIIVGNRKMLIYDDMDWAEPIQVHDKPAITASDNGEAWVSPFVPHPRVQEGNIVTPKITMREPLKVVCEHFVDCIVSGTRPHTDGGQGIDVVRVLEAVERSLRNGGREVEV